MAETKNEQLEKIRKEIAEILNEPQFQELPKAIKHALAQRLGLKAIEEGGLVLEFPVPITIKELKERGIKDDDPYDYVNVYRYTFH
jgi:hypothetical protein